jgi:hypothetical protein
MKSIIDPHKKHYTIDRRKCPECLAAAKPTCSADIEVPRRPVVHKSWSEGYRFGTRMHFILACGHTVVRPASRGENPKLLQCYPCWAIAACDALGHPGKDDGRPCGRCSRAREKLGTADAQIARQG